MSRTPYDPGVAQERTALAWQRSALSLLIVALLMLHAALSGPRPHVIQLAVIAVIVLTAGATHLYGQHLYTLRATDGEWRSRHVSRALAALSAVTLTAAAGAALQSLT
jgi:uncharacterized membrane protein YidH (DUF202 family)